VQHLFAPLTHFWAIFHLLYANNMTGPAPMSSSAGTRPNTAQISGLKAALGDDVSLSGLKAGVS
jgi:hypothetical protein